MLLRRMAKKPHLMLCSPAVASVSWSGQWAASPQQCMTLPTPPASLMGWHQGALLKWVNVIEHYFPRRCNLTKVAQWQSNPNGFSPESHLMWGGRAVNWPATNLQSSIWSQDYTVNPVLNPPQQYSSRQLACLCCVNSPVMYAGLSKPQVCCDPLSSEEALTLKWREQVEVFWQSCSSLKIWSALLPEQAQPCLLT